LFTKILKTQNIRVKKIKIKITLDFCLMHFLWKSELQVGMSTDASIKSTLFTCRALKLPTNDPITIEQQ
jgi:hypothetical protein